VKKLLLILLVFKLQLILSDTLTITFLGDTHFGENYHAESGLIQEYGYDYFFNNVKDLLLASDFTFANLETPLINSNSFFSTSKEKYVHYSNADSTAFYFLKYGISAVTIANNHILDAGLEGLNSTTKALRVHKIIPFGAGTGESESSQPFYKKFFYDDKILDLFVFGAYWYRSRFDKQKNYYANGDKFGVNQLNAEKILAEVKKIKEQNPKAFVVIYPHWGSNYKQANDYQRETARRLIDGGVDLIIGHGSHTIQEIESYNGKWIIYNIGNFIFNSPGRYESTKAKPYGFIVKLIITSDKKQLKLYPVYTNNLETEYQLRFLEEDEFEDCYKNIPVNNLIRKINYEYFEITLD
jgi:poly-gamma-glutamate capsule biosynthesis protein CapA/YwtB (metallophosphatase superfamily)